MRTAIAVFVVLVAIAVFFLVGQRPTRPVEERTQSIEARSDATHTRRPIAHDLAVAPQPMPTTHAINAGWGTAPNQVGRRVNPESAGEGPMAIAVGRDGTTYILDQVNSRILRRTKDGRWLAPIPLARDTAQDLRVDGRGNLGVLDRLGDQALTRYDANGRETNKVALASLGMKEGGGATGLYDTDSGELYVEESLPGQGKRVVHGVDGATMLAGRPSRDGQQLVQAQITSRGSGAFVVRGLELDGTQRWQSSLVVTPMIMTILLCETDGAGEVLVGVTHAETSPAHDLANEALDVFRLRSDGTVVGHLSVAHPPSTLETFRELTVGDDGTVYWMHPAADGTGIVVDALGV